MLISVIIPVYNCEKYIKKCVESLFANKISASDIEFIFVDDGSTDNSVAIIESYDDKRAQIIKKPHSNVYETWKTGVLEAKGEYIMNVDADDFVKPELFADVLKKIKYGNCDLIVFNYCRYFIKNNKTIISPKLITMKGGIYKKGTPEFAKLTIPSVEGRFGIFYRWNRVFKREKCLYIFDNVTNVDKYCCCFSEDRKIMTFIYLLSDSVLFIEKPYYFYRVRSDSVCHDVGGIKKQYDELENYFKLLKDNKLKFNISNDYYCNLLLYNYSRHYIIFSKLKNFKFAQLIYKNNDYNKMIKKFKFKNKILGFLLKHNMKKSIYLIHKITKK